MEKKMFVQKEDKKVLKNEKGQDVTVKTTYL